MKEKREEGKKWRGERRREREIEEKSEGGGVKMVQ